MFVRVPTSLFLTLAQPRRPTCLGCSPNSRIPQLTDDSLVSGSTRYRVHKSVRPSVFVIALSFMTYLSARIFSAFFRKGQVLETFRGGGIYQSAVDIAINKLDQGHWVHLFGEGGVNQPHTYAMEEGKARLRRFKWGVYVVRLPPFMVLHADCLSKWPHHNGNAQGPHGHTHMVDWYAFSRS